MKNIMKKNYIINKKIIDNRKNPRAELNSPITFLELNTKKEFKSFPPNTIKGSIKDISCSGIGFYSVFNFSEEAKLRVSFVIKKKVINEIIIIVRKDQNAQNNCFYGAVFEKIDNESKSIITNYVTTKLVENLDSKLNHKYNILSKRR